MLQKRTRIALLITTVAVVGATTASSGSARPFKHAPKIVTVGMIWSLSGVYAPYGAMPPVGANLAIAQINKAGGIKIKNQTYDLRLKVIDDRSDQQTSIAAANQLFRDDHVKFALGPFTQNVVGDAAIGQPLGAIQITTSSLASKIGGTPGYPLLFCSIPGLSAHASAATKAIKHFLPNAKTVAIVAPDDAVNQADNPLFTQAMQAAGLQVSQYVYPAGTTDISTVMTKVAAAHPDLIFLGWTLQSEAIAYPALNAAGIPSSTALYAYGGLFTNRTLTNGRPYLVDPIVEADFTVPKPSPAALKFENQLSSFLKIRNLDPSATQTEFYFDSVKLLAAAMQKVKSVTNTAAIGKALLTVKTQGIAGTVTYGGGRAPLIGGDYTFVNGNKVQTLYVAP